MSTSLRAIAQDNELFIAEGHYDHPTTGRVPLGDTVRAAADSTRIHHEIDPATSPVTNRSTRFEVTPESSLGAAERCHTDNSRIVGVLNFASARNPGGGYLNGAKAQEEDLCRCSALYTCLLRAPEFYAVHRASSDLRYSDRVISSPGVPVFRDDQFRLLPKPYPVTFLTSAAPNTGQLARRAPELLTEIPELLTVRAGQVLAAAQQSHVDELVLGAWGCGVFGNAPADVAKAFAAHLGPGGRFGSAFDRVVFAIYDRTREQSTLAAFRAVFG
ncbi:MAG TPA: TIGR02452 family protein [Pseudonocardiaceae bacterium]|nr:TIGR02452 family protein [Pseudonocardiaceae bacterium]